MKSEKEQLAEFIGLVWKVDQSCKNDILSKTQLMKGSLSSVRIVARDTIEVCSLMSAKEQEQLNTKLVDMRLPSLRSLQERSFHQFLKIANRGRIRNDVEHQIVQSLSETSVLNEEYKKIAYDLLSGYETPNT